MKNVVGVILMVAGVAVFLAGCFDAVVIDPGEAHAGDGLIPTLLAMVGLTERDASLKLLLGACLIVVGFGVKSGFGQEP